MYKKYNIEPFYFLASFCLFKIILSACYLSVEEQSPTLTLSLAQRVFLLKYQTNSVTCAYANVEPSFHSCVISFPGLYCTFVGDYLVLSGRRIK